MIVGNDGDHDGSAVHCVRKVWKGRARRERGHEGGFQNKATPCTYRDSSARGCYWARRQGKYRKKTHNGRSRGRATNWYTPSHLDAAGRQWGDEIETPSSGQKAGCGHAARTRHSPVEKDYVTHWTQALVHWKKAAGSLDVGLRVMWIQYKRKLTRSAKHTEKDAKKGLDALEIMAQVNLPEVGVRGQYGSPRRKHQPEEPFASCK
ncbi:hypothetical protein EDB87DRAFT_1580126 [Lactarius vividus]|nr:hypothetical protein EDB87DRAFT_1580126 [Lactarius vividus]